MNIFNTVTKVALASFIVVITAIVIHPYVPNNMDEFSLYHELACNYYPNNKLNTFRIGCNRYDLKPPFINTFLPIREYGYMGSILSLYLAPFFIIVPKPIITRIIGLLFIIIQSFLLSKLLRLKWESIFMCLFMFFPYFFQHYVDTGTIAIQITLLFSILLMLKFWFSQQRLKYLLSMAMLCFIGILAKLTFIWYFPSLIFYFLIKMKTIPRIPIKQIIISSIVFGTLVGMLFFSIDRHGNYYFHEFFVDNYKILFLDSSIFDALLNPYEATQLIFIISSRSAITNLYSVVMLGLCPFLWIWGFLHKKIFFTESMLWYAMFTITILMISLTGKAWSIHHVILAYPYLILSFFSMIKYFHRIMSKHFLILLYIIFVLYNLYFFLTFHKNKIAVGNEPIRKNINTMLANPKLAQEYIYVIVDWGMYYYQSLFGNREQTVVYIEPFSKTHQLNQLRLIRTNNHKKLLFIYNQVEQETDPQFIYDNFKVKQCHKFKYSNSWKILIESGTATAVCN